MRLTLTTAILNKFVEDISIYEGKPFKEVKKEVKHQLKEPDGIIYLINRLDFALLATRIKKDSEDFERLLEGIRYGKK